MTRCAEWALLYNRAMTKRKRPILTVTVDADLKRRLKVLAKQIPGGTLSGVVGELLTMTLPMMEEVVAVMVKARQADGSIDDEEARRGMAAWIGTKVLSLYDTQGHLGLGKEDGT
jgi:hypothetical protein